MQEIKFGLPAYYDTLLEKIEFGSLRSIKGALKKSCFDDNNVNVFFELCIILLSSNGQLAAWDDSYQKIKEYWEKFFPLLKNRISEGPSFEAVKVAEIFNFITQGKLKGICLEMLEKKIASTIIRAKYIH